MLARVLEVKLTLLIFEKALCALSISKGTTLNLFIEHLNKGRFPVRDVCFVSACPCLLVRVRQRAFALMVPNSPSINKVVFGMYLFDRL